MYDMIFTMSFFVHCDMKGISPSDVNEELIQLGREFEIEELLIAKMVEDPEKYAHVLCIEVGAELIKCGRVDMETVYKYIDEFRG